MHDLLSMFACEFRDGRPDAAPKLKRAAAVPSTAALYALRSGILPHQHSEEEIEAECPQAVPREAGVGEPDHTPETELGDPVPALERHSARLRAVTINDDGGPTGGPHNNNKGDRRSKIGDKHNEARRTTSTTTTANDYDGVGSLYDCGWSARTDGGMLSTARAVGGCLAGRHSHSADSQTDPHPAMQRRRAHRGRRSARRRAHQEWRGAHSETTSTSGTARCLEKAEWPGCFRAVGHSRTNAISGCTSAAGIAWTRGSCSRTVAHAREAGMRVTDTTASQEGPRRGSHGFTLGLYSCLRSRHTDLPVVLSIDGKETRVPAVDTRAQISFQSWQAEQVFLRCRHLPEEKGRQWTRARDRAHPRGERLKKHRPRAQGQNAVTSGSSWQNRRRARAH